MNVEFRCTQCNKKLSAPAGWIGRQRPCPQCGTVLTVPDVGVAKPAKPQAVTPPNAASATAAKAPASDPPLMRPAIKPPEDLIDVTAMVDIVFFMLIFFLVTSLQSLEAVINLPSPEGESGASTSVAPADIMQDPSYVVVTIDEDDTVWVEDEEVFGEQNLRSKLRTVRSEGDERDGLLVIGDPEATHGQLVMVLDAGADAGFKELMFSVGEQPEG